MSNSNRPFQLGLGALLFVAALGVLLWLWPRSFTPVGHILLASWVVFTIGFFGCSKRSVVHFSRNASKYTPGQIARHYTAFTLAVVAVVAPTVCFGLFWLVFGSGGSNVAQLAGPSGGDLWSIWFQAWLPLLFFSPTSVVINYVTYFLYSRPRKDPALFVMRICGLGSALISTWVVMTYFPDA